MSEQQAAKIPRVGFLAPGAPAGAPTEAFRQGLAKLGYVDGQNIVIEGRFAEGQFERFPQLAADLTGLKVDVIAMVGAVTARAAQKVVTDIPLVFTIVVDPVADDVVANSERPGGNITGVTNYDPQQARKRLELLRTVIPGLKRLAVLGDRGVSEAQMQASEAAARALGMQPQGLRVGGATPDLEGAFAAIAGEHADAVLILEEPVLGIHRKRIAELATQERLPTMFPPLSADAGGLLSYGTNLVEPIHRMAVYVDKILKGAKPGTLPVETVTRYDLIVNLKTARAIGATIPSQVVEQADRVIE
jgi:putative ABC transport system substrate-binding protein